MCKLPRWLPALLIVALLAACDTPTVATPVPTTITIAGATAMQRVLHDLTAAFSRRRPDVLFVIRGGGSSVGEELVRNGEVNLGASTLFAPEAAEGAAARAPDTLTRVPIGLDGLALIVHPSNSVMALSLVQLQEIFSGRVLDWLALGSDAGEIQLVSREDGSGARVLFETRVMGEERVSLTAVVMPTSADVVEYVAKNPAAIGYVSRAEVAAYIEDAPAAAPGAMAPRPPVKVLSVEGNLPLRALLSSQEYALTQPMYLITNGPASGPVREFIDFTLSPAGQAIVNRYSAPIR
jgi:phosphate transport system substrate-binding protein